MKLKNKFFFIPIVVVFIIIANFILGCATVPADSKGKAELWAEACMKCHNIRSPEYYSDGQWEVVMQHMRLRAYLTADEQKAILEFLKAAN